MHHSIGFLCFIFSLAMRCDSFQMKIHGVYRYKIDNIGAYIHKLKHTHFLSVDLYNLLNFWIFFSLGIVYYGPLLLLHYKMFLFNVNMGQKADGNAFVRP